MNGYLTIVRAHDTRNFGKWISNIVRLSHLACEIDKIYSISTYGSIIQIIAVPTLIYSPAIQISFPVVHQGWTHLYRHCAISTHWWTSNKMTCSFPKSTVSASLVRHAIPTTTSVVVATNYNTNSSCTSIHINRDINNPICNVCLLNEHIYRVRHNKSLMRLFHCEKKT